jgi:hypothetical protein
MRTGLYLPNQGSFADPRRLASTRTSAPSLPSIENESFQSGGRFPNRRDNRPPGDL